MSRISKAIKGYSHSKGGVNKDQMKKIMNIKRNISRVELENKMLQQYSGGLFDDLLDDLAKSTAATFDMEHTLELKDGECLVKDDCKDLNCAHQNSEIFCTKYNGCACTKPVKANHLEDQVNEIAEVDQVDRADPQPSRMDSRPNILEYIASHDPNITNLRSKNRHFSQVGQCLYNGKESYLRAFASKSQAVHEYNVHMKIYDIGFAPPIYSKLIELRSPIVLYEKIYYFTYQDLKSYPRKVKTFKKYREKYPLGYMNLRDKIMPMITKIHSICIIHGDIHDENIIIVGKNLPFLIDFGDSTIYTPDEISKNSYNFNKYKMNDLRDAEMMFEM